MSRNRTSTCIIEDPRIEVVARIEATRLWDQIEARLYKGLDLDFWHLRETILAENIPGIAKTYGKEVARRVEGAIMSREPHTVSKHVQGRVTNIMKEISIKRHGRFRLRDRICFALFGMGFS